MVELQILNQAINTLKNECKSHKRCWDCPLAKKFTEYVVCQFSLPPSEWEFLKGEEE